MSLESALAANTAAIERLCALMQGAAITPNVSTAPVIPAPQAPTLAAVQAAPAPQAPAMPAAPDFLAMSAPAPTPAEPPLPFGDINSLSAWATEQYHTLGPQKGANIQAVIKGLGLGGMADIKPEHYRPFYNGVMALH
jgi:hypothetical protein